jgi:hypothetical protein
MVKSRPSFRFWSTSSDTVCTTLGGQSCRWRTVRKWPSTTPGQTARSRGSLADGRAAAG